MPFKQSQDEFTTTTQVYMTIRLKKRLSTASTRENRSYSKIICALLEEYLKKYERD